MTLRVGIIGAGRIAWSYDKGFWDGNSACVSLASCFHRHPITQLVAVFDPEAEARAAFQSGYKGPGPVAVYEDLQSFLSEGLDLIAIASPSAFHAEHISACLDAQVPRLWVEKPVTLSLNSLEILRNRVSQMSNPPHICVNFMRRSLPQLAFMKRHLSNSPDAPRDCAISVRYSRGLDVNGVHMLDLLGALTEANKFPHLDYVRCIDPANPHFGLTLCEMPVTVIGHDLPYHLIELDITDSRGRLSLIQGGQSLVWEGVAPNRGYAGFFRLNQAMPVSIDGGENAMQEATYRMLVSLLDDSAHPISTLDTAWFSQALLEAVNAACQAK